MGEIQAQDGIEIPKKYNFIFYRLYSETEKKKSRFKHLEVLCSIHSRSLLHPSYYHSFGITENYIVFVEQPFKLDMVKLATAYMRGVSWASCLVYNNEEKVFFLMLSNGSGQASLFHTALVFIWFISFSNASFFSTLDFHVAHLFRSCIFFYTISYLQKFHK